PEDAGAGGAGADAAGAGAAGAGAAGAGGAGADWRGPGLGLLAGAGFAVLFIGLDRAGSGSGLWPVAAAQVGELGAALVGALVMAGVGRTESAGVNENVRRFGSRAAGLASVTGVSGGTGTILYFYATQHGLLAVVAVLTSLYPAITIAAARTLLGERLTWIRLAGLALAGACVALIAVGGAG
ncbi:MAG: EamA family transporter, partial [Streptosporangiaceae bacterium]